MGLSACGPPVAIIVREQSPIMMVQVKSLGKQLLILCGPASHYQTRLARLEIIEQAETIPKCLTKTFVISAVHINLHEVTFEECSTCCQLIFKKKNGKMYSLY